MLVDHLMRHRNMRLLQVIITQRHQHTTGQVEIIMGIRRPLMYLMNSRQV